MSIQEYLHEEGITSGIEIGVLEDGSIYLYGDTLFPGEDSHIVITEGSEVYKEEFIDGAGDMYRERVDLYEALLTAIRREDIDSLDD